MKLQLPAQECVGGFVSWDVMHFFFFLTGFQLHSQVTDLGVRL